MKKLIAVVSCFVLLSVGYAFSQETATYSSDHYRVISHEGTEHAKSTARIMEAYFELFESYMHFDSEQLSTQLTVRIFSGKEAYDSYLDSILSETRDSFVFIQYSDPKKSELVGFYTGEDETYRQRLIHHGYVQYLKSFIPNPPLWLQKGFAVYFENSNYNEEEQRAEFEHNYEWVSTLRNLLQDAEEGEEERLIPMNSLLYIDSEKANTDLEAFYAQVWGTLEFLVHSDKKRYNRLLWDSISALKPDVSKKTNEQRIVEQAFSWVPREQLTKDYIDFIRSIETFPELVRKGMEQYTADNLEAAKEAFTAALDLRDDHYIPYYYLGLINYDKGEYSMGEYYYHTALDKGGSAPLINYALGVNAYADERFEDARFYLKKSLDAGDTYTERINTLQKKIEARASGTSTNSEAENTQPEDSQNTASDSEESGSSEENNENGDTNNDEESGNGA